MYIQEQVPKGFIRRTPRSELRFLERGSVVSGVPGDLPEIRVSELFTMCLKYAVAWNSHPTRPEKSYTSQKTLHASLFLRAPQE